MKYALMILWVLILIAALSFAALNSHAVTINLYFVSRSFHLPVLLFLILCVGMMLGVLIMFPSYCRAKRKARQARSKIKNNERELDNLRRMPISEEH